MLEKIIGMSGNIIVHLSDRGEYVVDIDTTYGGQTSLSTLGTILVGNWRAAIINPAFGGTGMDNGEFTIAIGGNLFTTGPLVIQCDAGVIVSMPKEGGQLVNRAEALDPIKNLKDIDNAPEAYDLLSPTIKYGDMVYHDGITNVRLECGHVDQVLATDGKLPVWRSLQSYNYIMSDSDNNYRTSDVLPQRRVLNILSDRGLRVYDDDSTKRTILDMHPALAGLARYYKPGMLVILEDEEHGELATSTYQTIVFKDGNGIKITNGDGSKDPIIAIDPTYKGQESVETVGHIKHGYWGGTIVDPEFGGTGHSNQHGIRLGGTLHTTIPFSVRQRCHLDPYRYEAEDSVILCATGSTILDLPERGKLATEEGSLQVRHNLQDIGNPKEAFRHISPTQKQGDLIVRGWGDYDTVVRIGAPGQVLTVAEEAPGLVEWTDAITLEDVDMRIEEYVHDVLVELEEAIAPEPNTLAGMPLETVLEAILMQLDNMKHLGALQPINEMRAVLDKWTRAKHQEKLNKTLIY